MNIPNVRLSDTEYLNLLRGEKFRGGEAIICEGDNSNIFSKLFFSSDGNGFSMSENKEKKIEKIYQKRFDYMTLPIATLSYNGTLIGYQLLRDLDYIAFERLDNLTRNEKIEILKRTKQILLYYHDNDIIYGDVTSDNILVNRRDLSVKFCDIDNIKLGNYPIDNRGYTLSRYYERTGRLDDIGDAFMHNFMAIRRLSYDTSTYESEIFADLRRKIYPGEFGSGAKKVFDEMANITTFNGDYVIDYVKRR